MSYQGSSPLAVVVKGAIAGIAGTWGLTMVMQRGPQLLEEKFGVSPQMDETPEQREAPANPTGELAERVAEGVLDVELDEEMQAKAGQAIHWGYGAAWGAYYGVMQSSLRMPALLHGTLFGVLVATVASTVVPAIGLGTPPADQPKRVSAMQIANHLIYGWVVAIVFRVLNRG